MAVAVADRRRTDKRLAGEILLIAGLLADQHDAGLDTALAADRLGRALPQRAPAAARDTRVELLQ
jgi:hypothetical protein